MKKETFLRISKTAYCHGSFFESSVPLARTADDSSKRPAVADRAVESDDASDTVGEVCSRMRRHSYPAGCHSFERPLSRAELSTRRDYPVLKRKFSAIRKTYATILKPYTCDIRVRGRLHRVSIRLVDTMLIGPAGSSLASLGDALKLPKVELPAGYSKDRMDLFMRDHPALFERYAMVDAEIAARWTVRVFQLVRNEMGVNRQVATLGGVGVGLIEAEISKLGLDVDLFFRREKRCRGRPAPLTVLVGKLEFAAQCYHGGRNEALSVGFSPIRSHSLRPRPCRRIHDSDGDDLSAGLEHRSVRQFARRTRDNRRRDDVCAGPVCISNGHPLSIAPGSREPGPRPHLSIAGRGLVYWSRTGRSNGPRCRRKSAGRVAHRFRGRFTTPVGAVRPHNWTNSEASPGTGRRGTKPTCQGSREQRLREDRPRRRRTASDTGRR